MGWMEKIPCWSHLDRDFCAISERAGSKLIGEELLAASKEMFGHWHAFRREYGDRELLCSRMEPVIKQVEKILQNGAQCQEAKSVGTCRQLLKSFPALWTFLNVPGVEPTNNAAEQALRHGVLWRKGCFGTDSVKGSRFYPSGIGSSKVGSRNNCLSPLGHSLVGWNSFDFPLLLMAIFINYSGSGQCDRNRTKATYQLAISVSIAFTFGNSFALIALSTFKCRGQLLLNHGLNEGANAQPNGLFQWINHSSQENGLLAPGAICSFMA
uniref:Transposase IS66 central domain-containing protein n=1 Tax=Magnetococcus massalia (strain MO-1) TaxID=451514 RepID=A0A1S7LK49_MAGMO|nr:protein of unknown function [Candidatus Magnetococcus massalia]